MEAPPPAKKLALAPLDIGPATGEEDLNVKVLQVQNRKLSERLRERHRRGEVLEGRVSSLEARCSQDDWLRVCLRRQLLSLRQRLAVLLAPLGQEGRVTAGLGDDILAGLLQSGTAAVTSLEEMFACVAASVDVLGAEGVRALSQAPEFSDVLGSAVGRLESLLEDYKSQEENNDVIKLQDDITSLEAKFEQLENDLADARFDLQKAESCNDQLEQRLSEALETGRCEREETTAPPPPQQQQQQPPNTTSSDKTVPSNEFEQLQVEKEELQALSQARLEELKQLASQLLELNKEFDRFKLEHSVVPESAVVEATAYKLLQSQFSLAVAESGQLRAILEENKLLLNSAKEKHFTQLEKIREEELKYQLEVSEEMAQLQRALEASKREGELLRVEFERTLASNEQAAPIAKELQVTVASLQKTIQQLKSELTRCKSRSSSSSSGSHKAEQSSTKEEAKEESEKARAMERDSAAEQLEEVKGRLRAATEEKLSLETQLEGLRQQQAAKEGGREKADIILSERKARAQVEELKRRFEDYRKDYEKRKEHIREEASRRNKALAEDNRHLQKELLAKKAEVQALVSEMESTAMGFEEMQEQNIRLLQQLKEKDDANMNLMSERIKANSLKKLWLEEKELMESQLSAMATEKVRLGELMAVLEERDRNCELSLQSMEKELALQQQTLELHKRKALESVQGQQELQMKLAEGERQLASAQEALVCKQDAWDKELQLHKRTVEEVGGLKRRLERYKSREWASCSDEVLLEEIKTYKAKLNCPCCSARKKDTVLTKCFHVFCSECIRSRYDSRLRKCPKCGAAFGANDFHKIYLS